MGSEPESAEGRSRLGVVGSAIEGSEVDNLVNPPGTASGWVGVGCNEVSPTDIEVCVGTEVGPGSVDSGDDDMDKDGNCMPGSGVVTI